MLIFNSTVLFTLVAEIQFAYEWWGTKREGCIRRQKYNETVMRDKNKHNQYFDFFFTLVFVLILSNTKELYFG